MIYDFGFMNSSSGQIMQRPIYTKSIKVQPEMVAGN